jgi:hypothetical protein
MPGGFQPRHPSIAPPPPPPPARAQAIAQREQGGLEVTTDDSGAREVQDRQHRVQAVQHYPVRCGTYAGGQIQWTQPRPMRRRTIRQVMLRREEDDICARATIHLMGSIPVSALFDTGATCGMMRRTFYESLPNRPHSWNPTPSLSAVARIHSGQRVSAK